MAICGGELWSPMQCTGLGMDTCYGEGGSTHRLYGFVDLHTLFIATVPNLGGGNIRKGHWSCEYI